MSPGGMTSHLRRSAARCLIQKEHCSHKFLITKNTAQPGWRLDQQNALVYLLLESVINLQPKCQTNRCHAFVYLGFKSHNAKQAHEEAQDLEIFMTSNM